MEDLKPLLLEMQKANALQTAMLKEKRNDDTARQLFAGNMFEIFTQYDIFRRRNKEGMPRTKEKKEEDKQEASREQKLPENIGEQLIGSSSEEGTFIQISQTLQALFDVTASGLTLNSTFQKDMLKSMPAATKDMRDRAERNVKLFREISTKISEDLLKTNHQVVNAIKGDGSSGGPAHDTTNPPPPSAAKGKEKKQESKITKMTKTMTSGIMKSIGKMSGFLGEKIKKLTDGILGKSGLITLILLGILGLANSNKEFAKDMAALIHSFGALGKGIGTFFTDPGKFFSEFGTFFTESFAAILTTAVILFNKFIIKKLFGGFKKAFTDAYRTILKNVPDGLKKFIRVFGRFLGLPALIFFTLYDFITTFARKTMQGEGFFSALGSALYAAIVKPIFDLFNFIGKLISIPMIMIGNFVRELFTNPISFGKKLISGDFSDLTSNLPDLFSDASPSTPSTNLSASAMGPTGGATYNFNTVNAPAFASTNNHHHSNISITDSQQETTGLG
tara:strand:- start:356 stop:1870 length:1515 start_codon:yes stop_codon:yes gene_type:complete